MRYFLDISYKGTSYNGWQIQNNARTVQEEIQNVLSTILREPIQIHGSGRTDTGVHALQQIAHFDCEKVLDLGKDKFRFNSMLPADIAINNIRLVKDDAHARFDAKLRSYVYRVITEKDPFNDKKHFLYREKLDIDLMNEACDLLIGRHDFECFSKVKTEVNNFYCEVQQAYCTRHGKFIDFHISANRFLRNMIRAIMGTLLDLGSHKINLHDFVQIIESKNRGKAGRSVSPDGLYLSQVIYEGNIYKTYSDINSQLHKTGQSIGK